MNSKVVLCLSAALAAVYADGYDSHAPSSSGFAGSESRISQSRASFGGGGGGGAGAGAFKAGPVVPIVADDRQAPDASGAYSFNFETGDGVSRQEQGSPQGPSGAVAQTGGWSFTLPDGTPAVFRFVADENGFRVESDLLPTPPPLPPHAIEQIERARQEQASGRGSFASASTLSGQYSAPSASAPQFARPASAAPAPAFQSAGPDFASASSAPAPQFASASHSSSNNLFGASSAQAPQFGRPSSGGRPRPSSKRPAAAAAAAAPSTQYGPPQ
ncbi:pupal cuticle protein 20-like [Macrobrachium nipponense]|uniref:pupal cuticle protein 20-like n=1 Tax=Macrobrachium nipponense TaxID=159736 RepID=UPI0030C89A9B